MTTNIQHGFVLTRSGRDRMGKTEIEFWVTTADGPARLLISDERPAFFVSRKEANGAARILQNLAPDVEIKPLGLRTFAGEEVSVIYTRTISDQFTARDLLLHSGIEVFEADLRLPDRYLMERFICGGIAFSGDGIGRDGFTEYRNCRLRASEFKPELLALSLDIECAMDGELFSVGLSNQGELTEKFCDQSRVVDEVLMIGDAQHCAGTRILWYADEKSLLTGLCKRINHHDPDLLTGWNLVNFDMKILLERARKLKVSLAIGRGKRQAVWRNARGDTGKGYVFIPGRLAIDGIEVLRSATWSFPSWSLENVSRTLLHRGKKVDQDVDDRFAEIQHNFLYDKPALAAYNLEDCRLVVDIFAHTKIIDYLILHSQITGLELDRAGGSVAAFTNLYLPRLHRGGYVAPNLPIDGGLSSPGGYVMNSKPGLYRNVLVLDYKSLYPSIIRTFKIDPMGLIEGLQEPADSIEGFKGGRFHREKHFLPQIIEDLWRQRDQAKKEQDEVRSRAIKILMNSFYGVLGSGGCRFYDQRLASSITMRGHEIMKTTRGWIESQGYDVIYGDTDSTFVLLDDALNAVNCHRIGNDLAATINQNWSKYLAEQFDLECLLEIEFETHFSRFLMPTIRGSEAGSKKRYAGLIIDPQDQTEKIIFKGLESVRTDWTELAKEFQVDLFDLVFHDRSPTELIQQVVDRTLAGKCDHKLVYRKQLRRKLSLYVKNVPPHVKAARLADERNKEQGKSLRYQNRGWISYVITINGPEPLEHLVSAIDYDHYIDRQLKPVADAVLPFVALDFDSIISTQSEMF